MKVVIENRVMDLKNLIVSMDKIVIEMVAKQLIRKEEMQGIQEKQMILL